MDEAGKRIVELSTGLLGILFAVTAFGADFPPAYLQANPLRQGWVIAVLVALVAALLGGVLTVQPRSYRYSAHSLTDMRASLEAILAYKARWLKIATWLFFLGAALLAALVAGLVLGSSGALLARGAPALHLDADTAEVGGEE